MQDGEDLELNINKRRDRDIREAATWKNTEDRKLEIAEEAEKYRLGTTGHEVKGDFDLKRKSLQNEFEKRMTAADQTFYRLHKELDAQTLHYVWIDARDEKNFNEAKKTWDRIVNERISHGKKLSDDEIEEFNKKYGLEIVQQLKAATDRELKQKHEADQKMQAEKRERAEQYEKDQAIKKERQRVEEVKFDMRKNGMSATFDAVYTTPRHTDPMIKPSAHFIQLIEQEKYTEAKNQQLPEQSKRKLKPSEQFALAEAEKKNRQEMDGGMSM